jgi:hypothetical protein
MYTHMHTHAHTHTQTHTHTHTHTQTYAQTHTHIHTHTLTHHTLTHHTHTDEADETKGPDKSSLWGSLINYAMYALGFMILVAALFVLHRYATNRGRVGSVVVGMNVGWDAGTIVPNTSWLHSAVQLPGAGGVAGSTMRTAPQLAPTLPAITLLAANDALT